MSDPAMRMQRKQDEAERWLELLAAADDVIGNLREQLMAAKVNRWNRPQCFDRLVNAVDAVRSET